jgi:hypothetical protein
MSCTSHDLDPLCFDVGLDGRGMIGGRWLVFGMRGDKDADEDWMPMILRSDGVLDYGAERDERFGKTNLRDCKIRTQTPVKVWNDENKEYDYVIDEVHSFVG